MLNFNRTAIGPVGCTVSNLKLQIFQHMPKLSLFQFLDKIANISLHFSLNFWPDGTVADQLLRAVLYEFTLKFIKNEKNCTLSLR